MTASATIIPMDVVTRARAALDRFKAALASDVRLKGNPDALANVVNGVRPYITAFPKADVEAIVLAIHVLTGRDLMWVRKLLELSEMEVRRAFRSKPPKLDRHGYETIYPEDGWLGAYLLYAQDSEAPLGWHFWCSVAVLGMVARRNFYWDKGRYILYLNQYLMMVGETGLKKSTSIDQTTEILRLAAEKYVDGHPQQPPDPFYFSPDRVTPEALDQDLSLWYKTHPNATDTIAAILNDEVVTLLGKNVWGGDKIIHFLTAVYGGKATYKDASIGRGKREMNNLQISCLFGSAPDWIRDSVTTEMLTGGFLGRCVMVPRHDPHGIFPEPLPSDPVMKHTLAEALVPWISYEGLCECRRTDEATEWYNSWYHEKHRRKKPADPRMLGWWNRKDDHLHKLAAILRISEMVGAGAGAFTTVQESHTLTVDVRHFEAAVKILDDEEARLPKLIAMVGASIDSRNNERILANIEEWYNQRRTPAPHSDILRKSMHFIGNAWHFERAIDTLRQTDQVRVLNPGLGKRRRGRSYLPTWADTRGEGVDDEPEAGGSAEDGR